ncbi:hypothetical protein ACOMHN_060238 [Nucella lapillus]
MVQFFTFLLLCLATAHASKQGYTFTADDCKSPVKVFQVWAESNCSRAAVSDFVNTIYSTKQSLTASDLENLATRYCSDVKPKVEQCFNQNVLSVCSGQLGNDLKEYSGKTAAICNADAHTPRQEILSFLRENIFGTVMLKNDKCDSKMSFEGVNVVDPTDYSDPRFDQFFTAIKKAFEEEAQKVVNAAKTQKFCPQWKWEALKRILHDSDMHRPEPFGLAFSAADVDLLRTLFSD